MSDIVIRGSILEIEQKLTDVLTIIANREAIGFAILQEAHTWQYQTTQKDNVCPFCEQLHGDYMKGSEIAESFPFHQLGFTLVFTQPETHDLEHVDIEADCYCFIVHVGDGDFENPNPSFDFSNDFKDELREFLADE